MIIHDSFPFQWLMVILDRFLWCHLKCIVWVLSLFFGKHRCSDMTRVVYTGPGWAPLTISVWWRGRQDRQPCASVFKWSDTNVPGWPDDIQLIGERGRQIFVLPLTGHDSYTTHTQHFRRLWLHRPIGADLRQILGAKYSPCPYLSSSSLPSPALKVGLLNPAVLCGLDRCHPTYGPRTNSVRMCCSKQRCLRADSWRLASWPD